LAAFAPAALAKTDMQVNYALAGAQTLALHTLAYDARLDTQALAQLAVQLAMVDQPALKIIEILTNSPTQTQFLDANNNVIFTISDDVFTGSSFNEVVSRIAKSINTISPLADTLTLTRNGTTVTAVSSKAGATVQTISSTATDDTALLAEIFADANSNQMYDVFEGTTTPACAPHSLCGHWSFEETNGAIAADSTSNNNAGTIYGNPALGVEGINGSAINFDGINDYVEINTPEIKDVFAANSSFTVSTWINPTKIPTTRTWIFSKAFTSAISPHYQFDLRYSVNRSASAKIWKADMFEIL